MRPLLPFLLCLLVALPVAAQIDSCTVTIETIAQHPGGIAVFCGIPTQVSAPEKVKGDPVYLNFGGKYPHHTFTVVIWGEVAGKQRGKLVKRYTGRSLRINGWVKEHDGRPEIVVKDLKNIEVVR